MYKARAGIWILSAILIFCIYGLHSVISNWGESHPTFTAYSDVEDSDFANNINEIQASFLRKVFTPVSTAENADVIIAECSDNEIKGYKKYSRFFYTPIITYAIGSWDKNSGFENISLSENKAYASKIDLPTVLEAFEQGKEYGDIGISTKCLKGKIKIGVPAETSYYYDDVKELFYYALLKNGSPTEGEKMEAEEHAEKILGMCAKYGNIKSRMESAYLESDEGKKKELADTLYFMPESVGANGDYEAFHCQYKTEYSSDRDKKWKFVYPEPVVAHYYDLYIKEDKCDQLLKFITEKSGFSSITGVRMKEGKPLSDSRYVLPALNLKN